MAMEGCVPALEGQHTVLIGLKPSTEAAWVIQEGDLLTTFGTCGEGTGICGDFSVKGDAGRHHFSCLSSA